MIPQPPPGQGPIDPRGASAPPPAPGMSAATGPTPPPQQQNYPPPPQNYGPPPPQMYPPPPGPMYPPPMFFPPGMFKPQRSFARIIFTTLATAIFGLSITLNLYLLAFSVFSSGLGHSAGIEQTVLVEGDPKEKVAVIPVTGMILTNTADRFNQMLTAAEKDSAVKAIVVEVDTPGGAVTPSDEIHARILRFRQQFPNRPVVISMGGLATSGGYYISCAGQYVFAQRTTLTGNI